MTKLSGWVAIVRGGAVVGTKDLGSVAVEASEKIEGGKESPEYALPLIDVRPSLGAGEQHVLARYEIGVNSVKAVYGKEPIPLEPPSLEDRIAALEAAVFSK